MLRLITPAQQRKRWLGCSAACEGRAASCTGAAGRRHGQPKTKCLHRARADALEMLPAVRPFWPPDSSRGARERPTARRAPLSGKPRPPFQRIVQGAPAPFHRDFPIAFHKRSGADSAGGPIRPRSGGVPSRNPARPAPSLVLPCPVAGLCFACPLDPTRFDPAPDVHTK